eukprot:Gregarina_sp_Pseudo_9__5869@NODE_915_length_2064_cov_32_646914_g859_i0_p1_GENE_NODE_915_length_2064_cov_32_646914_g859_i0NODE_915_length_2064_cov_32_646914_g859_i0_p1_ORF_typecomplete_len620_score140_62Sec63/PF02889_16/1_8e49DnaJ/PF00226_31/8_9e20Frag1/PF10277_9/0_66Frag1/PF10277_9/15Ca_hom_mod/PF14798_6/15Ca_hom_mod/PF14798_6/7_1e02Ca_hom_mod/PF14798_6/5_6DUF898/PF05987_13/0_12O_anti_polymase/PF01901_16/0_2O_anti_polymase/PF01901_16/2_3e02GPI2/PF06432_11/9e02GPI2/PF06432_11/59GPI2/PF06432_11/6_
MSFKDAFTKEDSGRSLLEYDDGAFYYFAATTLFLGLAPWTYYFVKSHARDRRLPWMSQSDVRHCACSECVTLRRKQQQETPSLLERLRSTRAVSFQSILILLGWIAFAFLVVMSFSSSMKSMSNFNPFEILAISPDATEKQIKKAFRTLSLKYHPDKNRNDPNSAAKFLLVSKAYHSLTDEVAKRNFEKYGNPDGPGMMKVGIGLPQFLVQENSQVFILMIFFIVLLVLVPAIFISYYQRAREYSYRGLKVDTVRYISAYLSDKTQARQMVQFICSAAETREIGLRPSDVEELKILSKSVAVVEDKQFKHPVVRKNLILLQAHMQRLNHLLSPSLLEDQRKLLKQSMPITKVIIDLATYNNWLPTLRTALDLRQHILQAVDLNCAPLMQLPHVQTSMLNTINGRVVNIRQPKDFRDFVSIFADNAEQCLPGFTAAQLRDVRAVVSHMPNIELSASIYVEDEDEIGVGDIATCKIKLVREQLKENEIQGPVHAPYFPEVKFEEWFFFVSDAATSQLMGFQTAKSVDRVMEVEVLFPVRAPGKHSLMIVAICDAYVMLQKIVAAQYVAKKEEELNRKLFVHPEDLALDNAPSLLQTMIGGTGGDETSDDDDDESGDEKKDE